VFLDSHFDDNQVTTTDIDYGNTELIDTIFKNYTSRYAVTDEKYIESDFFEQVKPEHRLSGRGIEVGHIFMFGTKYSEPMQAMITSQDGKNIPIQMGSYGIGVSRLVAALIEASHDEHGIIWHKSVTPYHVGLVNLRQGSELTDNLCEDLYAKLHKAGLTVLYHDTDDRAGTKFSDMDLIGLPFRVAIGPKGAEQGMVEIKNRKTGEITEYFLKL
jgi:prolyl-tRNA synthetase